MTSSTTKSSGDLQSTEHRLWLWFGALFAVLLAARWMHVDVLWVDEAYGIAAARELLGGKALYRDLWFDKPPLYAWFYLLEGGVAGAALRVLGSLFALLCCWLSWGAARAIFGEWEGRAALLLMAFFLVFGLPSAIVSIAPDMLTIPFALGTAWLAASKRPVLAGAVAGAALMANAKALFLLPVVVIWLWRTLPQVLAGYLAAVVCGLLPIVLQSAYSHYWAQVWAWGAVYSRDTFVEHPVREGILRTLNWMGFHAALVLPGAYALWRNRGTLMAPMAVWLVLALASVAGGWRFFPRYYFALLPVAVLLAATGLRLIPLRVRIVLLVVTLAIPAIRFGKPQIQIAWESWTSPPPKHRDLNLWLDARRAAQKLREASRPGDTLLVWGYRPELNVLAGLPAGTRFLDSQPLTGVIADRHLFRSQNSYPELSRQNRQELLATAPTWIADGLGPFNRELAIDAYAELAPWLENYQVWTSTEGFVLYRRKDASDDAGQ